MAFFCLNAFQLLHRKLVRMVYYHVVVVRIVLLVRRGVSQQQSFENYYTSVVCVLLSPVKTSFSSLCANQIAVT